MTDRELIAMAREIRAELYTDTAVWRNLCDRLATALEAAQVPEGWQIVEYSRADGAWVKWHTPTSWSACPHNGHCVGLLGYDFPTAQVAIAAVEAGDGA